MTPAPGGMDAGVELTPEVCAELLNPESWATVLALFARTTGLAVALADTHGRILGTCFNPHPIWELPRTARPEWVGDCPFCMGGTCTASTDALASGTLVLTRDAAGFVHACCPLLLGARPIAVLFAGQVFDRFPEPLPLQRLARDFGLPAQRVAHLARQRAPLTRTQLTVYAELLQSLGKSFLRDRFGDILERTLAETAERSNRLLAGMNSTLKEKIFELDRSNGDLQNLLQSSAIATIFLDVEARLNRFTPAAGVLLQLADTDIGKAFADLDLRFAADDLAAGIAGVMQGVTTSQEYSVVRQPGQTRTHVEYWLMRVLPYRTVQNLIDGTVITFVDVTKLKQAQQDAVAARVYSENVVETVQVPLVVMDAQFRLLSANESFYTSFDTQEKETTGRLLFELGDRQWDIPELRRLLGELLPREQWIRNFEMEHDFAQSGRRTMVLNARRIDHAELILLTVEDITERKRAETDLRALNENLKHFSYAVSHDLQEPLRMVMTFTKLLSRNYQGKLGADADQYIGFVLEGAQRLEALLNDLRQYWLLSGRMEDFTPVNCEDLFDRVVGSQRLSIEEAGAHVTRGPLPTLMADEVSLETLFQNLVGNAVKYRRKGENPSVLMTARKLPDAWDFSVADRGIGIKKEHLEAVFAPFKRLHGREYPGTGIGLTLCRKIVERYGGRLWINSTYGEGSTFHFTIPTEAGAPGLPPYEPRP